MGLDMYLSARRYLSRYDAGGKELADAVRKVMGVDYTSGNLDSTEVKVEAVYWRKANSVHAWFVKNVQEGKDDCQESEVSREQLIELTETCKRVLTDPAKLGPELLPTQNGFFFGDTDYGDDYIADLQHTVDGIAKALKAFNEDWSFEYRASW